MIRMLVNESIKSLKAITLSTLTFKTYTLLLVLFFSLDSVGQSTGPDTLLRKEFIKGKSLSEYYSLDSIQSVFIHNLKGDHFLSKTMTDSLIKKLATYTFSGNYDYIKPGYLWGRIIFLNGSRLNFNGKGGYLIITNQRYGTFIANEKINFENF